MLAKLQWYIFIFIFCCVPSAWKATSECDVKEKSSVRLKMCSALYGIFIDYDEDSVWLNSGIARK